MISPSQQTIPSNQQSTEQVAVQRAADSTTSVAAATAAAVAATAPIVKVRIFSETTHFPLNKELKGEDKLVGTLFSAFRGAHLLFPIDQARKDEIMCY